MAQCYGLSVHPLNVMYTLGRLYSVLSTSSAHKELIEGWTTNFNIEDGLMLEIMLRDVLEKNVPGYKEFRNTIVEEWVRQQVDEM